MSIAKRSDIIPLFSSSEENAPPWAALEVVSITASANGRDLYTVRKPTGDAEKSIVFNGPVVLRAGGYGAGSNRSHVRALTSEPSGKVGPVSDNWSLTASATAKTHKMIGGDRDDSYQVEKIGGGESSGDFGFARLYSTLDDTDAVGYVKEYTPILGTDTPGTAPAEVANPNDLEGSTNDVVIVTLTDSGWAIAAVLEFRDAEHGFARPYEDFTSGDTAIRPSGYQSVEGVEAPDAMTASVTNPGFSATSNDTIVVAKRAGTWTVCYVIDGPTDPEEASDAEHGFCRPYEDFDDTDTTIRPIGYQNYEGDDEPDDTTASVANPGFSAKTTDTLAVAKRSGVWTVCYVISTSDTLRIAIAELSSDIDTGSPAAEIYNIRTLNGGPSTTIEPADAANPLSLTGEFRQQVLLRETPPGSDEEWEIVAVLPPAPRPHGIATLDEPLVGETALVTGYRSEDGSGVASPTVVTNPLGLVAGAGVDVDVAYDGSDWYILDVRGSAIAIAELDAELLESDEVASITYFRWLQGNDESPEPTEAGNAIVTSGASGDTVLLTNRSGQWEIAHCFGAAASGTHTPCWITSAATAATESGGDITAQEVTVYLDSLGATPADRVAGTVPITAYWDDPWNPIAIASGKARRGAVALTTLGTLDVLWASCDERTFTP